MDEPRIDEAAALLARARRAPAPIAGLPEACRPGGEDAAYAVQERLHARLSAAGLGAVAGTKIGCTTPVMQRYMKIDHPCAGGVFAATVAAGAGRFGHGDYRRVGVECEIVVRLGRALGVSGAPHTRASVAEAVAAVMAGIEVVEDRFADFRAVDVWTLAADDFFNAGCVLGPEVAAWRGLDLGALAGRMTVNGAAAGAGTGRDILGHPLAALAWLAELRARQGADLAAGSFVMLGSMVQTQWLAPGDTVEIEVEGLGRARAVFP